MKKSFFVLLFVPLFYIVNVYADEPIIAVTDGNLPPFAYDKEGKLDGAYVEIVNLIFKQAAVDLEMYKMPFARAMQRVSSNKNMMYFPMGRTKDRINNFKWVGPILEKGRMNLYRLRERDDIKITTIDDAKNYMVGVVQGYSSQTLLQGYGFKNGENLVPVTTLEQNVKKLLVGRVDLIVAYADADDELIEMYGMTKQGTVNVQFLDITTAAYLAFNKETSPTVFESIKKAHLKLHQSTVFQDIATKHLAETMISN